MLCLSHVEIAGSQQGRLSTAKNSHFPETDPRSRSKLFEETSHESARSLAKRSYRQGLSTNVKGQGFTRRAHLRDGLLRQIYATLSSLRDSKITGESRVFAGGKWTKSASARTTEHSSSSQQLSARTQVHWRDPQRRCGTVAALFTNPRTRSPQQALQMFPRQSHALQKSVQVELRTLADGHGAGRGICQRSARWAVQQAGRTRSCHFPQVLWTCNMCRVSLQFSPRATPWNAIVTHRDVHCHEQR